MKKVVFLMLFSISFYSLETNDFTTNIQGKIAEEDRLPNIYLKNQSTNKIEPISETKRFDAVYFIAVPITYYVTFNLLQQKNWYIRQTYTLDRSDEVFLYFNTFFLPLIVAYFDYTFVQDNKARFNYFNGTIFRDSIYQFDFYFKEF